MLRLAFAVPWLALPFASSRPAAVAEPPLRIEVKIGDTVHSIVEGQEVTVTIAGQPTRVGVSVAPTRRFADAGVEFDYARQMRFELDLRSDGMRDWTLSGQTSDIYVHELRGLDPQVFCRQFLTNLAPDDTAIREEPFVLGGVRRPAFSVVETEDGKPAKRRVATWVTTGGGVSVAITACCTLDADGTPDAEGKALIELLSTTFALAARK